MGEKKGYFPISYILNLGLLGILNFQVLWLVLKKMGRNMKLFRIRRDLCLRRVVKAEIIFRGNLSPYTLSQFYTIFWRNTCFIKITSIEASRINNYAVILIIINHGHFCTIMKYVYPSL